MCSDGLMHLLNVHFPWLLRTLLPIVIGFAPLDAKASLAIDQHVVAIRRPHHQRQLMVWHLCAAARAGAIVRPAVPVIGRLDATRHELGGVPVGNAHGSVRSPEAAASRAIR